MTPAFDINSIDLQAIRHRPTRAIVAALLALLEECQGALRASLERVLQLEAEICRLKGEHPRLPRNRDKDRAKKDDAPPPSDQAGQAPEMEKKPKNYSSEAERQEKKERKKASKRNSIGIDRRQDVPLDRSGLPPGLVRDGIVRTVVQDILFRRDNVEFVREKWRCPVTGKTYLAPLPPGYRGGFGPSLRSFGLDLAYGSNVTFEKVHGLLTRHGIDISSGKVSSLLTRDLGPLTEDREQVLRAGLDSSPWQQLDVTSTPVGKVSLSCHTLCNPLYSYFQTTAGQDRAAILATLWGSHGPRYRLNESVHQQLAAKRIGHNVRAQLRRMPQEHDWSAAEFVDALACGAPDLGKAAREILWDAGGIAAYQAAEDWRPVQCLLCDDAGAFHLVTPEQQLCWVHTARHYTLLNPGYKGFRNEVQAFRTKLWAYYRRLAEYRKNPRRSQARRLSREFDKLFAPGKRWKPLEDLIARTRANKDKLLLVLKHPELPLHNNACELAVRVRVIKRRVSHGPKTPGGAKAWDTFHTLSATAAKLGINFSCWLDKRLRGDPSAENLAELIRDRARVMKLGRSWVTT